jgi:membrane protease subunit HflC
MRKITLGLLVVACAVLARMSVFTVDPTEYVYVMQFGRHVATYDGSLTDTDAGLHFRWPWPIQAVRRVDRRVQSFDLPPTELLTRDPGTKLPGQGKGGTIDKTLTVEAYVCWRVAGKEAVDRFLRRMDTPERARAILGQRINSELGALIGQMRMEDLISKDAVDELLDPKNPQAGTVAVPKVERNMERLRAKLLERLKGSTLDEYGIELIDIRLRRFNHPAEVRPAIFARIEAERMRQAATYRNEGKQQAKRIVSEAQAKAVGLKGKAATDAYLIEQAARTTAVAIRFVASEEDRALFEFLEQMKTMTGLLAGNRTALLLSTHHSIFGFLFRLPNPDGSWPDSEPGSGRRPGEPRRQAVPGGED